MTFQSLPRGLTHGPAPFNLTAGGTYDVLFTKLNSVGNFVWAGALGGPGAGRAEGREIAVDGSGNVYTAGNFAGTGDFDPGAGTYSLTATPDGNANLFSDALVLKLVPSSTAIAAATAVRQSSPTVTVRHTRAINSIVTIPSHVDARYHTARTEAADRAIASLLGSATRRRLVFGNIQPVDQDRGCSTRRRSDQIAAWTVARKATILGILANPELDGSGVPHYQLDA